MRHEAEVGGRHLVAHGGDGVGIFQDAGDGFACNVAEASVGAEHHVVAVLHNLEVDVQAAAGLSGGDFRCEGNVVSHAGALCADNPFGYHQLIGGFDAGNGEELYLVLLVDTSVEGEVAHLVVSVLNLASGLCYEVHAGGTEVVEFGVGGRFVVTFLVAGGEEAVVVGDYIVFQLAHGVEVHAG